MKQLITNQDGESRILVIDRSQPFDPVKFSGRYWGIVEEDERSLALTEVDLAKVCLVHMLRDGETFVRGDEALRRLRETGYIRLDAKVLQTLLENQELIPESWKERVDGHVRSIYFGGTELHDRSYHESTEFLREWLAMADWHYILSLCWSDGQWEWHGCCLKSNHWGPITTYAVLPSV